MDPVRDSTRDVRLLSGLMLALPSFADVARQMRAIADMEGEQLFFGMGVRDLENLEALAISNHVILRAFEPLQLLLQVAGNDRGAEWVSNSVQVERQRIGHSLNFLVEICAALENGGCPVTVIKSLDHWPDLGNDLDLYTDAPAADVIE